MPIAASSDNINDNRAPVALVSFNDLPANTRFEVPGEDLDKDELRFFFFRGRLFDVWAFDESTPDDSLLPAGDDVECYCYEMMSPGEWQGEYDLVYLQIARNDDGTLNNMGYATAVYSDDYDDEDDI